MPFFKEQKDNLELQFEKPNVNFLVDPDWIGRNGKITQAVKEIRFQ